ncbi:hypothetical protein LWI29_022552 [Acer saccharum]|uniref:START domain-containing protein n=1 Tax=Acer saccharum TaxID=4024 RepID=A0AA39VVK9_ACESA|nr:hypothetical protein LWI29_022552 [Acer saccharum]
MDFNGVLEKPSLGEICTGMIVQLGPVWVAFLVGLMVGWLWKPKWVCSGRDKYKLLCSSDSNSCDLSLPSRPDLSPFKRFASDNAVHKKQQQQQPTVSVSPSVYDDCSTSKLNEKRINIVTEDDLEHLWKLVEVKDGGPAWIQMMDRSTQTMSYQAWRRDPKNGPPQYRSRTVFEDATPEIVRDLFWDDLFRSKWDDMLAYASTIEECPTTGTMLVHWIRKFPFFCSDRDYIIGRRIWESGRSYYCVTKGVPSNSVPRRDKPRRVDLYYSSWCIRAAKSRGGNGQLSACEVLLFHHEDMGIPNEIAKLGIRQGMWGAVKKIEPGLRAYQKERASGAPLSRPAFMAQINTKINPDYLRALEGAEDLPENEVAATSDKPQDNNIPKLLVLGGAIILACSLDRGLLPKAFIFGVARRFANMGKKL